jgi:diguanylate cyclase (GGDEF)-like protein/putative nucleotidyltransferase with HDIG domain
MGLMQMAKSRAPTFRGLPVRARIYIPTVIALAAGAVVAAQALVGGQSLDIALLAIAVVLCAVGNLFEVFAPANFSFQPNLVVFLAGSLLLPPWAIAILAVASFVPGWFVHRFPWYMVAFNVANYTLAGVAAHAIVHLQGAFGSNWSPNFESALALGAAAIAFVLINHALIVLVVTLARGRSLRRSIDDMLACLPIDTALALTGACFAALWAFTPPLALLAAGPMVLIYRALWVPLLEHKSRTDPKTGLYNSEYLGKQVEDALEAASRSGSRLSIVMIDLDQLRVINNRHGHLAGDEVIRAVANVVSDAAAGGEGIAARFGGDELCVLLPDTSLDRAREVADELRASIERIEVPVEDGDVMAITASTGVAAYPDHAETVDGLLRAADAAVYDAKLGGRNRTRTALPPAVQRALALDAPEREAPEPRTPFPEAPAPELNGPPPEAEAEADTAESEEADRRLGLSVYIGLLCAAAALIAGLSSYAAIPDSPWLFGALIVSVVLLDAVRIDVFDRANLSPAAVPTLALACLYGPIGPIAAEAMIALGRIIRRDPVLKWAFDFGALSLAGAAAAATFDAFPGVGVTAPLLAVAVLAGAVYYIVNSALLAVVMGLAEGRGPLSVWRERLAWMVPHYLVFGLVAGTFVITEDYLGLYSLAIFGLPVVTLWIAEKQYLDRSRANVTELREANDELKTANARMRRLLEDNEQLLRRMHRSYLSTITSLARAVEAKDPYTSGHTERVARIAVVLAEELGFDNAQLQAVEVGAIIHDIGKVGIADEILLKPGPLSPEETREMRKHPELSSYIVADLELPPVVKQMARSHHERYDGTGYPDGLAGEEIPLAGRILSVADALDAMTSDRPYRKAMPLATARAEIQEMSGSQFCPRVVAVLMETLDHRPDLRATFPEAVPAEPEPAANGAEPEATPRDAKIGPHRTFA